MNLNNLPWDCMKQVEDIISRDELESILETNGISFMEVHGYVCDAHLAIIGDNSFHDLLSFLSSNGINNVIFEYLEVSENDVIINEWDESRFDATAIKTVRKYIDDHNDKARKLLDSSGQEILAVIASYGGVCVGIIMSNPTMAGLLSVNSRDWLQKIIDDHDREISDAILEEEADMDLLRKELTELILSDPEFIKCTNKVKRKAYILKFQKSRKCDKYRNLFKTPNGREVQYMYTDLIEGIWNLHLNQIGMGNKSEVWLFGEKV